MAPGDSARQAAELAGALSAAQQFPTASNRLRYAIALGAAGHASSNPVEARRLITELLAGQHDLKAQEVALANACLREFDARVALYADIARQREDLERQLQAATADDDRRHATLTSENARLKKALAEAERKLEAVAEMERTLIEQSGSAPANDQTPPRP
jgi:plasmid stability protein